MPFGVALTVVSEPPTYKKIAEEAVHLSQLGINFCFIAGHLGVDRTTVTRAMGWIRSRYLGM
jgi:hypothetical protein